MERPTLRQLEALDTIAREGSFRAAARALGVSQVAVSDHIKQLEARFGVSLFERSRGGKAKLSAAGEAALQRARLILADSDALVATMRDFAGVQGRAVAAPRPVVARETVPEILPEPVAQALEADEPMVELPVAQEAAVEAVADAEPAPDERPFRPLAAVPEPAAEPFSFRLTLPKFAPLEPDMDEPDADEPEIVLTPPDPLPAPPEPPAIVLTPPEPLPEPEPVTEAPAQSDQPITIGTHPSILARFQERLAAFEDAFPNRPVSVDFNCFTADRVALALSAGIISMAYFYAMGETRVFPSDYLWSERWALYAAADHPLAALDYVHRENLTGEGLLSFAPGNKLRPLLEACLVEAGLGSLPFLFESDDYGQLVAQAREGLGVLPLFGAAAARIGASSGLKRLPYVDPIPAIEVRRVVHPNLAEDDEVQALVATLE